MKRRGTILRTCGVLAFFGLAMLVMPLSAHAGGVHVDIGFELPVPVVIPAPPVVVAPRPVIVQPAPVVVQPAPVIVSQPPVVYERWLPPGIAKKYYGEYPKHWKRHHHDDD